MRLATALRLPSLEMAAMWAITSLVIILGVAIFLIGYDALTANLAKLNAVTLAFCLLLMVWQVGGRFLRWIWYARCLGLPLSMREGALFYGAGLGMTMTPGRLGELLRLWFLERRFAARYRRIAGLYVMDRISDAVTYVILFAVGSVSYSQGAPVALSSVVVVGLVLLILMRPWPVLGLLTAAYAATRQGRKLVLWLRRAIRNTSTLSQPRVFLPGLLIGTIGWLAAPVVLSLALAQMGVHLPLLHATAIYAAGALAGGATMLPGGGGGTEAVLIGLLRASDVPMDAAVASVIVTRVTFLWAPVGLGIAALPIAMKAVRR
jgi:glycosyltransferase 2 family protein